MYQRAVAKMQMTKEVPSDQTTSIEISGDNDEEQQDAITPKPEKAIPTKMGKKSAQQLTAERKQREAERALRDTERAKKRLSMRTKIAVQKNKASDPLLRLYQFAYESMTNMDSINPTQIIEEWDSVVESCQNEKALKTINGEKLLSTMRHILSIPQKQTGDANAGQSIDVIMNKEKLSAKDETINDTLDPLTVSDHDAVSKEEIVSPVHRRPKDDKSKFVRSRDAEIVSNSDDTKSNEPEDTNTDSDDNALGQKLYTLCADDQVDEAIMLILRYKLKDDNHSALAICKYEVQDADDGHDWWGYHGNRKDSFQYAIERVYPHFMDKKSEINQHAMRRLFLFKMLLKEGAPLYESFEGEVPRLESVWGTYWKSIAKCTNGDAVDLIFQCGVDIHDVNHKEGTKEEGRKHKMYTAWTPIQKSILQRNVSLMKHLLNAGAKSTGYYMRFFKHRDRSTPFTALCPTAMCTFWTETFNYLELKRDGNEFEILKCFLKHCDPKKNGFPNVNHYSFIQHYVLKKNPPTPPPKEEDVPNTYSDDLDQGDEYDDEDDYYDDSDDGL